MTILLVLLTIFVPRDDESLLWCLALLGYLYFFICCLLCVLRVFTLPPCFPQLPRLEATVWNSRKITLSLLETVTFLLIALLIYETHYLTIVSLHQRSYVLKIDLNHWTFACDAIALWCYCSVVFVSQFFIGRMLVQVFPAFVSCWHVLFLSHYCFLVRVARCVSNNFDLIWFI